MDNVPIVLAQYRLGKTLGIGAFGKVKRKLNYKSDGYLVFTNNMNLNISSYSCSSYRDRFKSCRKDFK